MRTTHRLDVHTATTRLTLAVLLACLPILAGPAATANDLCGETIVADLKLDHDLTCVGAGLIAGADGIKIDLNGYTLTGSGSGVGIAVTGRTDVSIAGGTIRNFAVAVRVNTSTDVVIKQIEFVENPEGVDLQAGSVGNTIKDNAFLNSATRGIILRSNSSDNDIKNNTFTGNRVGILVFGGVDNTLKQNIVSGSSLAGIRLNVIATGNMIKNNSVVSNVAGIEFVANSVAGKSSQCVARYFSECQDGVTPMGAGAVPKPWGVIGRRGGCGGSPRVVPEALLGGGVSNTKRHI